MAPITKPSPPVHNLLTLMKQPYHLEDGVRLDFLVNKDVTGKELFSSIILGISTGLFDGYVEGVSYYPQEFHFSSLRMAYPWITRGLIEHYNGIILIQEQNHFPPPSESLAYFYHRDTDPRLAYLHIFDKILTDSSRVRNIVEPWSKDYSGLTDTISQLVSKHKRGRR